MTVLRETQTEQRQTDLSFFPLSFQGTEMHEGWCHIATRCFNMYSRNSGFCRHVCWHRSVPHQWIFLVTDRILIVFIYFTKPVLVWGIHLIRKKKIVIIIIKQLWNNRRPNSCQLSVRTKPLTWRIGSERSHVLESGHLASVLFPKDTAPSS